MDANKELETYLRPAIEQKKPYNQPDDIGKSPRDEFFVTAFSPSAVVPLNLGEASLTKEEKNAPDPGSQIMRPLNFPQHKLHDKHRRHHMNSIPGQWLKRDKRKVMEKEGG